MRLASLSAAFICSVVFLTRPAGRNGPLGPADAFRLRPLGSSRGSAADGGRSSTRTGTLPPVPGPQKLAPPTRSAAVNSYPRAATKDADCAYLSRKRASKKPSLFPPMRVGAHRVSKDTKELTEQEATAKKAEKEAARKAAAKEKAEEEAEAEVWAEAARGKSMADLVGRWRLDERSENTSIITAEGPCVNPRRSRAVKHEPKKFLELHETKRNHVLLLRSDGQARCVLVHNENGWRGIPGDLTGPVEKVDKNVFMCSGSTEAIRMRERDDEAQGIAWLREGGGVVANPLEGDSVAVAAKKPTDSKTAREQGTWKLVSGYPSKSRGSNNRMGSGLKIVIQGYGWFSAGAFKDDDLMYHGAGSSDIKIEVSVDDLLKKYKHD